MQKGIIAHEMLPTLNLTGVRRHKAGAIALTLGAKCAADNISGAAAAIAFFSLFTAFPGIGIIVSLYGLVADPSTIQHHIDQAAGLLPDAVVRLLADDLRGFVRFQQHHLGLALTLCLLFTVTSGRATVATLMAVLNTIYGSRDRRHVLRRQSIGLALVLAILALVAVTFTLVALTPLIIYYLVPVGHGWRHLIDYLRWPLLAAMMMASLSYLYRIAPQRDRGGTRWFSLGPAIATALWLIFSLAYSYYLGEVGSFNVIYGSVSATIVLLMWLYLSSLAVLIGAEIDAFKREDKEWRTDTPIPRTPSG